MIFPFNCKILIIICYKNNNKSNNSNYYYSNNNNNNSKYKPIFHSTQNRCRVKKLCIIIQ